MDQGQELKRFCEAKSYYENHYMEFCKVIVNHKSFMNTFTMI